MKSKKGQALLAGMLFQTMTCCIGFTTAQTVNPHPHKFPVITNDKDEISLVIAQLDQAIRKNDRHRFSRLFENSDMASRLLEKGTSRNTLQTIVPSNIQIQGNDAKVLCKVVYNNDVKEQALELPMRKIGFRWRIEISESVETPMRHILPPKGITGSMRNEEPSGMSPESFVMLTTTQNSLISVRHPYTPESYNIFLINQSVTQQYIERNLFGTGALLSHESVWFSDNNYDVAFTLDNFWARIVFGRNHPSDSWIRSYGDHAGEYQFNDPRALTIDAFDTIWVADKRNEKIVKLFFNRNTRLISYVCSFSVPGIIRPVDISIDQGTFECNPNDGDGIWIADDITYRIVKVNRAGQVVAAIENYTDGGSTYRMQPSQVVCSPFGFGSTLLGVVDQARNAFVFLDGTSVVNNTAPAIRSTEFDPATSMLTCAGFDYFGQFWVGDARTLQYHTFSDDGEYLASTTTGLFLSPTGITRAQHRIAPGCANIYAELSMVTSDRWGLNTGMRMFFPGADAINLSVTQSGSDFVFRWTNTNAAIATVQVVDGSGNVYPISSGILLGSVNVLTRPVSMFPYGSLRFRVQVLPRHNDLYGGYARTTPIVREITFYNLRPISNVSIMRTAGTPSTYVATVTGGEPPFNYGWTMMLKCCSGASPSGGDEPDPTCNWQDAQYANGNTLYMYDPAYSFWVRVNVYDSQGLMKERVGYVERGACFPIPGGGCPFVFTWDGRHFVEDNNILPQSEAPENRGRDVVDRYKLMQPPVPRDNQYVLQIREFENERSYLDQVKLIAVDHNSNREVAMNAVGDVVSYEKCSSSSMRAFVLATSCSVW